MLTMEKLETFIPRPVSAGKAQLWDEYAAALTQSDDLFAEFGIDTALELQHFMAQIAHESDGFGIVWESMNYRTPERILAIFGEGRHSARVTPHEASQLIGKPELLAERVYGLGNPKKAMELGNREPGDGYRYRGYGPMQITGRADHERLLGGETTMRAALRAALREWDEKGCCQLAANDDLKSITRKINGGYNGLAERRAWLAKAKRVWPTLPADTIEAQERTMVTLADLRPGSRKLKLLAWIKRLLGIGTGTTATFSFAETYGQATEITNVVKALAADHVLLLVGGGLGLGIFAVVILERYLLQDYHDGRYLPSGG